MDLINLCDDLKHLVCDELEIDDICALSGCCSRWDSKFIRTRMKKKITDNMTRRYRFVYLGTFRETEHVEVGVYMYLRTHVYYDRICNCKLDIMIFPHYASFISNGEIIQPGNFCWNSFISGRTTINPDDLCISWVRINGEKQFLGTITSYNCEYDPIKEMLCYVSDSYPYKKTYNGHDQNPFFPKVYCFSKENKNINVVRYLKV